MDGERLVSRAEKGRRLGRFPDGAGGPANETFLGV
jgi:hypothetical protein